MNPIQNHKHKCSHEENNPFDMFAVKVCDDVKIVGHLPIDISRPTKYLLDRGAVFTVELTSTNYQQSRSRKFRNPSKSHCYNAWNSKKSSSYGKVQRNSP